MELWPALLCTFRTLRDIETIFPVDSTQIHFLSDPANGRTPRSTPASPGWRFLLKLSKLLSRFDDCALECAVEFLKNFSFSYGERTRMMILMTEVLLQRNIARYMAKTHYKARRANEKYIHTVRKTVLNWSSGLCVVSGWLIARADGGEGERSSNVPANLVTGSMLASWGECCVIDKRTWSHLLISGFIIRERINVYCLKPSNWLNMSIRTSIDWIWFWNFKNR